ncbi:MAG: histidine--tRNA ligase [Candidatus Pacebacteria bacterium]|nr:histidine--tRNA ligase [Candidatus Paceibacterota bacterium]
MQKLQSVRGTHDLLPEAEQQHQRVITTARSLASTYGFAAMATPLIEFRDVFSRAVGETSDIVSKEMFIVQSPSTSGDDAAAMVLRPEGTAAVMRALINGNRLESLPQRVFYAGPMFRYERPQKGRLRQFHQIGVEAVGAVAGLADGEIIALAARILNQLLPNRPIRLELNSLGDRESREQWRQALVEYFTRYESDLSPVSRERLHKNPLRILDSKEKSDLAIVADAPELTPYLTAESLRIFDQLQAQLQAMAIPYHLSKRLVRGLDYYCHTVFEFVTDELGAQGTVLAGGRYDGLVAALGGAAVAGIGWAAGIERLVELMVGDSLPAVTPPAVMVVGIGANQAPFAVANQALILANRLRAIGIATELDYSGNPKKALQRANRIGSGFALMIGSTEVETSTVQLKNLTNGEQITLPLERLLATMAGLTKHLTATHSQPHNHADCCG